MCYMILLSTDSDTDLSVRNTSLVQFSRELPPLGQVTALGFPHKWFVASRDACSCGFRHLHSSAIDLGFDVPQDWYHEEPEDLAATKEFVAVVQSLLAGGASVDCIDVWGHETATADLAGTMPVSLDSIGASAFRFMEGYRFTFASAA